jgi:hypothetical protein
MDWCKINWKGAYPIDTAQDKVAAKGFGIYSIYGIRKKEPELIYIGEVYWQKFGKRLQQHKREWLNKVKGKMQIRYGTIELPKGKVISHARVLDIEATLIHHYIPPFNTVSKKGYRGRNLLIFNIGSKGDLDKIVSDDPELISLLKNAKD